MLQAIMYMYMGGRNDQLTGNLKLTFIQRKKNFFLNKNLL